MTGTGAPGTLLAVRGLRRSYRDRVALDGLSFEVGRGEVFGFLGPNGAGKSTAFGILAGLLAADAGEILLDGRPVSPADAGYRARLGVVFQSPSLDPVLSGRENLRLAAALYGVPRAVARERIAAALAVVDLAARADERVGTWSGGMRRRLEIARVLLSEPDLLVLDEPGQGLDLGTLRRVWEHVVGLARARGMGVLLTTHSPDEAEFCDRLAVLEGGRMIACDTPAGLKRGLGGDVLEIEPADAAPERIAAEIAARFALDVRVVDGTVMVTRERGHELIPRLVEAFPPGHLRAVGLRPPSLGDVFARLTGKVLA